MSRRHIRIEVEKLGLNPVKPHSKLLPMGSSIKIQKKISQETVKETLSEIPSAVITKIASTQKLEPPKNALKELSKQSSKKKSILKKKKAVD